MLLDEIVQVTHVTKQDNGTSEIQITPLEYVGQHPYLTLRVNIADATEYPEGKKFRMTLRSIDVSEALF